MFALADHAPTIKLDHSSGDDHGVHYYSDYFDSLRMGERLAVGMLYEQMGTYAEAVRMRFHSFDGDRIELTGDGNGGATLAVDGQTEPYAIDAWWRRHQGQPGSLATA